MDRSQHQTKPAALSRRKAVYLCALRGGCFLGAAGCAVIFGSWFFAGGIAAIWVIADIGLPRVPRIGLSVLAALWLLVMFGVAGAGDFLGYRIAHGTVYRADEIAPVRGIEIEYTGGANGGSEHRLVGNLRYDYYEGPYGVQIFLHDRTNTAVRAKITNAKMVGEDGNSINLDMRDEVRWYDTGTMHEDGWIPFQTYWGDLAGGRAQPIYPIRCGLKNLETVDLQSLGGSITMTFTLHLDMDREITQHEITVHIEQEHVASSGITVHS